MPEQLNMRRDEGVFPYTPNADVAAGTVVVIGDVIGVTKVSMPANKAGFIATEGEFSDVPKAAGGGTALALGQTVFWDATNRRCDPAPVGRRMGVVSKAAADADTVVSVILNPDGPGPQAALIVAITDSTTGTGNDTCVDVGNAFNQATLNNNFADLIRKVNQLTAALKAAGIVANS